MQYKLINDLNEIVGFSQLQADAELLAALKSKETNDGIDIHGLRCGHFVWLARFVNGRLTVQERGAGFRTPQEAHA